MTELSYLTQPGDRRQIMIEEVRRGLTAKEKYLPSKYLYDARGSQLFERITTLPDYYLTPTETEILAAHCDEIMSHIEPAEIIELGSGSSRKTRNLIESMQRAGCGDRYLPIDVSEAALRSAAERLSEDYQWLRVEPMVGDFVTDLDKLRRQGRRLIIFLGSTIGNYPPAQRLPLLRSVAGALQTGDGFLLGVDLVKDEAELLAAYNDSTGVSAEFNRNVLRVINREMEATIPVDAFEHVPKWDSSTSCVSHNLRATREVRAKIAAIDLDLILRPGEEIHTQLSCKFTREGVEDELGEAGMTLIAWYTDPEERYGLALAAMNSSTRLHASSDSPEKSS